MDDQPGDEGRPERTGGPEFEVRGGVFLSPKMLALCIDLGLDDEEIAAKLKAEPERVTALRIHLGL